MNLFTGLVIRLYVFGSHKYIASLHLLVRLRLLRLQRWQKYTVKIANLTWDELCCIEPY